MKFDKSFLIIVILATFMPLLCFFGPTQQGYRLLASVLEIALSDDILLSVNKDVKINFVPTRYSIADLRARDIGLFIRKKAHGAPSDQALPILTDSSNIHHKQLALAVLDQSTKECDIYVSAQTFEKAYGAYAVLANKLPDEKARWNYILLHERTHCYWNPTLLMENHLKAQKKISDIYATRQYKYAEYLSEAYADTIAALSLIKLNPGAGDMQVSAISEWRQISTNAGMKHRTHHALLITKELIKNKQINEIELNDAHQLAFNISVSGMYYWLLEQGHSRSSAFESLSLVTPILSAKLMPLREDDVPYRLLNYDRLLIQQENSPNNSRVTP